MTRNVDQVEERPEDRKETQLLRIDMMEKLEGSNPLMLTPTRKAVSSISKPD
jgi:hypothetical protein